MLNHI
jgi:DNA polymerase I-like protein with 3'-5' exonuclease and polymerase domains